MNEVNNATHPEANVLPTLEASSEPPVPGDADYEAAKCALEHNVAQDMRDPLLHLSDETLATLESLAYHNIGALTRLERTIKDAIVEANQGESRARAFSFKEFRQAAASAAPSLRMPPQGGSE